MTENAFGIMANRFHIYRNPDRVVEMCRAIASLHNFLRKEGGHQYLGQGNVDSEDANHQVVAGDWRNNPNGMEPLQPTRDRNPTTQAKENRDELAIYFAEGAGSVPWQENMIGI